VKNSRILSFGLLSLQHKTTSGASRASNTASKKFRFFWQKNKGTTLFIVGEIRKNLTQELW